MIELTEQQLQAISSAGKDPAVVVDPKTKTPYVVLRQDMYERLKKNEDPDYDAGPWTVDEMNLLADEAEKIISQAETHEP